MMATIATERFTDALFQMLDETFEHVHGIYLDRGTSLFETLAGIPAEVASRPVSARCASLAAQVEHIRFYLEVTERSITGQPIGPVDWHEIWRTVRAVTPEEWAESQRRLAETYQRITALLRGLDAWEGENEIGGAMAVLVHTAYHLGEIRQALCTLS
jgi:hypothetical protein